MKNLIGAGSRQNPPLNVNPQTLAELAARIRLWRKRHGLTQAELASQSGISVSFISMIERGERSPSYETLVQVAKALDISLSELFRSAAETTPTDEGYYRKLTDFARSAHLSRKQVEQLILIGQALFGPGGEGQIAGADASEEGESDRKRCSVPGCVRPMLARGLCSSHYRRDLRQKSHPF